MIIMRNSIKYIILLLIIANSDLFANRLNDTLLVRNLPNDTAKCRILAEISEEFKDINTIKGVEYGEMALELSRKLKYNGGIADAYKAIGGNNWRQGMYDTALNNFLKALNLFKQAKNLYAQCRVYNNIGLIYFARTQYDKTEYYLQTALKLAEQLNNDTEQARITHNLALLKFETYNANESIKYHNKSLQFATKAQDIKLIAYNYCFLGKCYTSLKQYDSAKSNLEISIELFQNLENPNNTAMAYNQYANYLITIGKFKEALVFTDKALVLSETVGNQFIKMECAELKTKAYIGLKDYKSALKYNKLENELSEKMKNESNIKSVARLESKFEYEHKLNNIELQNEKEIIRTQLIAKTAIITAILLLGITIIAIIFYKHRTKTNLLLKRNYAEISHLNTKLEESNSTKDKFFSIIAHDLKNPLGSLREMSKMLHELDSEFTPEERVELLHSLKISANKTYTLLENLLEWSRSQRGVMKFEPTKVDMFAIAQNSIDFVKYSAKKKDITLINGIPQNTFIYADINLLHSVVRNLLTNSIKFSHSNSTVEIGILNNSADTCDAIFYVKDTGIGITPEDQSKLFSIENHVSKIGTAGESGTGLGLILCKEFIDKHNGKIWIESAENIGTSIFFMLGYNKK